jgi:mRNA-degrading endonuclease HigB of HigAB toxin-antitoxin module
MRFTEKFLQHNQKFGEPQHNKKVESMYKYFCAAENGDLNTVKYIYAQGTLKFDDNSALFFAVKGNQLKVVEYLCEDGNGAEITDNMIMYARAYGYDDVLNYLRGRKNLKNCENTNTEERNPPNTQDCW